MIGLFGTTSSGLFCIILEYSYNENHILTSPGIATVSNVFRAGSSLESKPFASIAVVNRAVSGPLRTLDFSTLSVLPPRTSNCRARNNTLCRTVLT